ncbi:MAG: L,D-transpeptidase family protein [Pseudomonadota bacterium]
MMIRKNSLLLASAFVVFLTGAVAHSPTASAQDWRDEGWQNAVRPVAQDVIRDDQGRHFLVDRRTGRVIKRLWRDRDWQREAPANDWRSDREWDEGRFEREPSWQDEEGYLEPPRSREYFENGLQSRFERRARRRLERRLQRQERKRLRRQERLRERARLRRLEEERYQAMIERRLGRRDRDREWMPQDEIYEEPRTREEPERIAPRAKTALPKQRPQANPNPSVAEIPVERGSLAPVQRQASEAKPSQPKLALPKPGASSGDQTVPAPQTAPSPNPQDETQVARLPDATPPLQTVEPIPSLARPAYGSTRMMELQIVLDRAGFSPGVIDGRWGTNVEKALKAYRLAKGKNVDLRKPAQLAKALTKSGGVALVSRTLTQADVSGPYVSRVPIDYARKAAMKSLAYTSVAEKLAEKFHVSESLLTSLNPGKKFRAGETIKVPAVGSPVERKVHYLVADKSQKQVRAYDRNGVLVAAYPATIGSQATPSPSGTHTIERIAFNPQYTYDPKKNFKQGSNDKILVVPPGPNGPVGSVWIALSKESYGIHGTPRPDKIGKTNSHGCIRLTNWDANELARLVRKGVTVEFKG